MGVWARVLPFGRTGALPAGGQYSRVESSLGLLQLLVELVVEARRAARQPELRQAALLPRPKPRPNVGRPGEVAPLGRKLSEGPLSQGPRNPVPCIRFTCGILLPRTPETKG